jgi:hypothetical protein
VSIREAFAAEFGEDQAAAVMAAAIQHKNGIHDNPGSDSFKWALLIAIGHECLTRYRDDHGITADADEMREWIKANADLRSHDGDCDYLALICGAYDEYLPSEGVAS